MNAVEYITAAYMSAVKELIECYGGTDPEFRSDATLSQSGLGAVVGFADGMVKGSSVLIADAASVLSLAPMRDFDPRDWLGELNNQTVGRFKNKVVPGGLMLQLSTPVTAEGEGLRFGAINAEKISWVAKWPGGTFQVLLVLTVPSDLTLTLNEAVVVSEEGSIDLF